MAESLPHSLNLPFLEGLYADYLRDPATVSSEWRRYFDAMQNGEREPAAALRLGPSFRPFSVFDPPPTQPGGKARVDEASFADMQDRVDQLVRSYRFRGHMIARINPLDFPRKYPPELSPEHYGFKPADMDRRFSCQTIDRDGPRTLSEIVDVLWNTYCRSVGVEYMHIDDAAVRDRKSVV